MSPKHVALNAAEGQSVSRLLQDPRLPVGQPQVAVHDPDTQVTPEVMAHMVDWIKATVYSEQSGCPSSTINAKWATQVAL